MLSWQLVLRLVFAVFMASAVSACTQSGQSVTSTLEQPTTTAAPVPDSSEVGNVTANSLSAEAQASVGQRVTEGQAGLGPTTGQQTAALSAETIAVLPLEGAPQTAMSSLSKSLKNSAIQRGLNLQIHSTSGASYRVKGYFSALSDGSGTLLVYVWDVLDQSGRRVHRINGQERSGLNRSDPWLAISEDELSRVADRTAAGLKAWIDTKKS